MKQLFCLLTLTLSLSLFASPIKSNEAAKSVAYIEDSSTFPSAADYVQDGLVAMWDGVENVGWGRHKDVKDAWVDLVSGQKLKPYYANTLTFSEDACVFQTWVSGASVVIDTDVGFTIEVVGLPYSDTSPVATGRKAGLNVSAQGLGHLSLGALGVGQERGDWTGRFSVGVGWYNLIGNKDVATVCRCIGNGEAMVFSHSGLADEVAHPSAYPTSGSKSLSFGGGGGSYYYTINSIRVYDRPLTEEEVLYNYEIDKMRFDLP